MLRLEKNAVVNFNGVQSPHSNGVSSPSSGIKYTSKSEKDSRLSRNMKDDAQGRVRVTVRLRPRNAEELRNDADFANYVELMPELKKLKLKKNNWDCDTFQFDEILNETASQKRVYEVVAKPVVESVLDGYNGTIMAYGQTGTGKTFTLGKLGGEDVAERGIMMRALEHVLTEMSADQDVVTASYLQIYMENVQDLLAPEKENLIIVEDPKTGDVSLPGATSVEISNRESFIQLLQSGEANRTAANTKMNTESSRSHALLLVNIKRDAKVKQDSDINGNGSNMQMIKDSKGPGIPIIRKSKLLIVDLAGSERVQKTGSNGLVLEEAKFINLSLTALGKCIHALAEGSTHVPIRDSKLTRLLRDSFGGTARTSLIITIGPSPRHRGETTSTILFGQRAMKLENVLKLKGEFDYQSHFKQLQIDMDRLISENERLKKVQLTIEDKMQKKIDEAHSSAKEAAAAKQKLRALIEETAAERKNLQRETKEIMSKLDEDNGRLENEVKELRSIIQGKKDVVAFEETVNELENCIQKYQSRIYEITKKIEAEHLQNESFEQRFKAIEKGIQNEEEHEKHISDLISSSKNEKGKTIPKKQVSTKNNLKYSLMKSVKQSATPLFSNGEDAVEIESLKQELAKQTEQKHQLKNEIESLKRKILQIDRHGDDRRKLLEKESTKIGSDMPKDVHKIDSQLEETINGRRTIIGKLSDKVDLKKILSLLESEDSNVRVNAIKMVANLAAEESNQEKIVAAGGLPSLLKLLFISADETTRRVAVGAIANLAMNETNQELIVTHNGIRLLSRIANDAKDPQTLRMVAGALANLCANEKLQNKLREEGGIKTLMKTAQSGHSDVLVQIARGVANLAKSESKVAAQGQKIRKSFLIEDGALPWIVANATAKNPVVRHHTELALCHLAHYEANTKDLAAAGALWEIKRISEECSKEDIRNLARTIVARPNFQLELEN